MTTEKAVKVGLEVTGKLGVGVGGQHLKKGIGNIGGLHKIRGLALLCQLGKETLKIPPFPPL